METPAAKPRPRPHRIRRFRLPVAAVLVGGFSGLILLAVASVLGLGLFSAGRNTYALLNDKADLVLQNVEIRVRHQLDPARAMVRDLAGMIGRGELNPADRARLADTLRGALGAMTDVTGVSVAGADGLGVRVGRIDGVLRTKEVDVANETGLPEAVRDERTRGRPGPEWIDPVWSPELRRSLLVVVQPVYDGGRFLGQVAVAVSLGDLSRFLSSLFVEQGINAFVLYDQNHVLAHATLAATQPDLSGRSGEPPLPRIDEVDDPTLATLWSAGEPVEGLRRGIEGYEVDNGGDGRIFLLRRMTGYGRGDWLVGVTFSTDEVNRELKRLALTGGVGLAILLLSVGVALVVGRRISAQVARLAEAADQVRALDFQNVPVLPDSRLRELARAAAAFNSMVAGLRWFETYVPKALVLQLMRRGGGTRTLSSEERTVTVMFTDIRGFSRLAEHLGAAETAALLNDHFSRLATCIEAEGGTVDKFIGDAIMAFWGAPEDQADHAARALRAARAIALAIHADNRLRTAAGLPPVRVRIGLHSGPVVVGNIGSVNRINYTIVGDTVNVAARIEELGSRLQGDDETIVLASAATVLLAQDAVPAQCVGDQTLRGRDGNCEVWRIDGVMKPEPAAP